MAGMAPVRGFTGWVGTVIGTPDPPGLGRFYADLLGGELDLRDGDFVTVKLAGTTYLACQLEENHVPPVWPTPGPGEQQMQMSRPLPLRCCAARHRCCADRHRCCAAHHRC